MLRNVELKQDGAIGAARVACRGVRLDVHQPAIGYCCDGSAMPVLLLGMPLSAQQQAGNPPALVCGIQVGASIMERKAKAVGRCTWRVRCAQRNVRNLPDQVETLLGLLQPVQSTIGWMGHVKVHGVIEMEHETPLQAMGRPKLSHAIPV